MKRFPILITVLILFPIAATSIAQETAISEGVAEAGKPYLLTYPSLEDSDGKIVFTNDHVVLQRQVAPAGEWEGIHSHPGNRVYVQIKGGTWSECRNGTQVSPASFREAGAVGWIEAVEIGEAHEAGNVGDTTIDLVLITLE